MIKKNLLPLLAVMIGTASAAAADDTAIKVEATARAYHSPIFGPDLFIGLTVTNRTGRAVCYDQYAADGRTVYHKDGSLPLVETRGVSTPLLDPPDNRIHTMIIIPPDGLPHRFTSYAGVPPEPFEKISAIAVRTILYDCEKLVQTSELVSVFDDSVTAQLIPLAKIPQPAR